MIQVQKDRSERNKTITLSRSERIKYKLLLMQADQVNKDAALYNKIIQGDISEISKKLPAGFADLLVLDPPYNMSKDFNETSFKKKSISGYTEYIDSWLPGLLPLLKPNASVYICADYHSSTSVYLLADKYFKVRNRITWQREKGRGANSNWKNSSEDIWFCTVGQDYKFNVESVKEKRRVIAPYRVNGKPKDWEETPSGNFRLTHPSNFWNDLSVPYWSMSENTDHPTQKPEKLLAKIILASSDEGDLVLDPFCGSGTTAVTAKKLNRVFCGIDIDEEYCLLALKRIEMAESNPVIQGYQDGVFWERNSFGKTTASAKRQKTSIKNMDHLFGEQNESNS